MSLLCLTGALLLTGVQPAAAQGGRDAMIKMSQEAAQLFKAGKFAEAAQKFQDASKESWEPILVKNEMIAWYKADRCDDAIIAGKTYLSRTKAAEIVEQDRKDANVIMFDCHLRAAATALDKGNLEFAEKNIDEAKPYNPNDGTSNSRLAGLNDRLSAKRKALADQGNTNKPNPDDKKDPDGPKEPAIKPKKESSNGAKIAAYTLLGAGGVGLISTIGYSVVKNGDLNDRFTENKCDLDSSGDACQGLYDEESSAQMISIIGYSVSGALLLGGAALLYLSLDSPDVESTTEKGDEGVSFFPAVGPGQAGVGMRFSF